VRTREKAADPQTGWRVLQGDRDKRIEENRSRARSSTIHNAQRRRNRTDFMSGRHHHSTPRWLPCHASTPEPLLLRASSTADLQSLSLSPPSLPLLSLSLSLSLSHSLSLSYAHTLSVALALALSRARAHAHTHTHTHTHTAANSLFDSLLKRGRGVSEFAPGHTRAPVSVQAHTDS